MALDTMKLVNHVAWTQPRELHVESALGRAITHESPRSPRERRPNTQDRRTDGTGAVEFGKNCSVDRTLHIGKELINTGAQSPTDMLLSPPTISGFYYVNTSLYLSLLRSNRKQPDDIELLPESHITQLT